MPYFLIPHTIDPISLSDDAARAAATAEYAARADAYALKPADHAVLYVQSDLERYCWQRRERERMADGTYRPVPWAHLDSFPDHFVHLSTLTGPDDPPMVAYTPDPEAGHCDKQIRVKPGKYLERFYSHLRTEERSDLVRLCKAPADTFRLASTADDIETLYRNARIGSCMGPDSEHVFTEHPTRAYGDSDLAVAYLGELDDASARTVVWPARKLFIRIYGPDAIRIALMHAGYRPGSAQGARIRCIPFGRNSVLMPYLDGIDGATIDGDYIVLDGHGLLNTRIQTGAVDKHTGQPTRIDKNLQPSQQCEDCGDACDDLNCNGLCDSCEDNYGSCEHCEERFNTQNGDSTQYCDHCERERTYCEHCDSDTWEGTAWAQSLELDVCRECSNTSEDSRFYCLACNALTREWRYSAETQVRRIDNGTALRYCASCEADHANDNADDTTTTDTTTDTTTEGR